MPLTEPGQPNVGRTKALCSRGAEAPYRRLLLHPFMREVLFCIGFFSMKILSTTIFGGYHYFLDLKFYVL